jgi:predicted nucleic acid-binding protein
MTSMSARVFLDTNVVVYAYDRHDPAKQARAQQILREGLEEDTAVVSAQVLGEFLVTVTRKIPVPLSLCEARNVVDLIGILCAVDIDRTLVKRAIETQQRYEISYWDSLIVAAAERSGCQRILSEDLQHGQSYHGVTVENPFL